MHGRGSWHDPGWKSCRDSVRRVRPVASGRDRDDESKFADANGSRELITSGC